MIDDKPIGAPLNRNLGSPVAPGEAVEAGLDRLITRRHDARVSFARTLGVEQSELIRLDTCATKKRKESMTELVKAERSHVATYHKYTPREIIDALEVSRGLIAPAARNLGCSRDTIRKYLAEYPEVAKAKADMREAVTDSAESSLYRAIEDREAWAVCFYLKTQAKDRGYVERAELSGANGAPVKIKLVYDE